MITMTSVELIERISNVRKKYGVTLSKVLRDMQEESFVLAVLDQMQALDLIRKSELSEEYKLMPIVGKLVGRYQGVTEKE